MLGVGAPQVRARPSAEVGVVPFGLMDPFPPKIPLEINVKRTQAAIVLHVPVTRRVTERLKLTSPPRHPKPRERLAYSTNEQVLWATLCGFIII